MDYFAGLDVSVKDTSFCIVDDELRPLQLTAILVDVTLRQKCGTNERRGSFPRPARSWSSRVRAPR